MIRATRSLFLALPLAVPAMAAASLTISNVSVTGASVVNQYYLGSNGYSIVFDAASAKVTGDGMSKQFMVTYDVTSTAPLVGYTFSPLGTVFRGDVNASVKHDTQSDAYAWSSALSSGSTSSLAQKPSNSLSGLYSYHVTATIDLSTLAANPKNKLGISSLSQYNIAYTTAPVPEPATLAVLGVGALGLLRRRRAAR